MFGWRRLLGQAGMMMAGGLFLLLAVLLAGVAVWLALAAALGPVPASLAVAGAFLLLGGVLVALSFARPRRRRDSGDPEAALRALFAEAGLRLPEPGARPPLVEAFLFGLTTALRLNRAGRR